ncbi:hypothetical protein F2Q70_00014483 [Brassica cretica]|uniref:Uncharacterized protein n=1 Tax=Brassica cretica TaxID=69181 RepID=A0A8S9I4C2_BRACR|nr:hypothetical protein F2Q70_00014483 [Brassica cretica]
MVGGGGMEELTEDEKRALRGSKFAPLTSLPSSSRSQLPRHSVYITLLVSGGASSSGRRIQHVAKFEDVEISSDDDKIENTKLTKKKKKKNAKKKKEEKKKKKNKKHKIIVDEDAKLKRPNKKLKL